MSKIPKPKNGSKAAKTLAERSGWSPRITERPLASGAVAFQADWWEPQEGGGYSHRKKQLPIRADLEAWIEGEQRRRIKETNIVRRAERRGDAVVTLANLTPKEKAALAAALASIRAAGGGAHSLADAAHAYAQTHLTGAKKKIWRVVGEQLREIKARRRPATYADRRRNLAPLVAEHGRKIAAAFTRGMARDWIFGANTPAMQAARKRALHALFSYAEEKGYLTGNPVAKIKVEIPVRDEVSILSPAEAAELMGRAEKHAPALVPYLATGLFAGLRPMNELRGLDWRDIDLDGGNITVRRASSKTNRARLVPISPNLRAWLETVPPSRRRGSIYYSRRLLDWIAGKEPRQDWRVKHPGKIRKKAEAEGKKTRKEFEPLPWGQDILRHTRTSYRLAQTKNAPLVAEEGGHTPAIMKLHYANRTIPAAAVEKFWAIAPGKPKGK